MVQNDAHRRAAGQVASDSPATAQPERRSRWRRLAGRHRWFLLVALAGVALRLVVVLAYDPALWFQGDTFSYLRRGVDLRVHPVRPMVYAVLLRALEPLPHSLAVLTALQHLLGLGVAALVYALLVRLSVPPWAAALAVVPALLDGYQLQLEHLVMSDVLYAFLTTAAVVALLWHERLSPGQAAAAGLLLGAAAVTRSVGLPVAVVLLGVLLLRRAGWRAVAAATVAVALPVVSYAAWFHAGTGRWAHTHSSGAFLYSRVMAFADCDRLSLTAEQRALCDPRPAADRPESSRYLWNADLPLRRLPGPVWAPETDRLAGSFAVAAMRGQPVDYARQVAREVGWTFSVARVPVPAVDLPKYEFQADPSAVLSDPQAALRQVQAYDPAVRSVNTTTDARWAAFLDRYQDVARTPGPLLGVLLAVALAGLLPVQSRRAPAGAAPLSAARALTAVAAALLVLPPMTAQYDPRYVLAAVPVLAAAAALSATGLARVVAARRGAADAASAVRHMP